MVEVDSAYQGLKKYSEIEQERIIQQSSFQNPLWVFESLKIYLSSHIRALSNHNQGIFPLSLPDICLTLKREKTNSFTFLPVKSRTYLDS